MAHWQAHAQNEPYYGGNGDGNSSGELVQYAFVNPPNFSTYAGGNGDGNSSSEYVPYNFINPPQAYAYVGGNGDGNASGENSIYAFINPPQPFAYFGGNGDGNAYNENIPFSDINPPQFFAYFGGNGDGNSNDGLTPFTDMNPPMFYAYFGGVGDGNATALLPLFIPNALPVNLLSFDGKAVNEESELQWKVSLEKNIKNYALQRSGNGSEFQTIYTEKIWKPSDVEKTYHYTDTQPLEGANYYRLQINDLDGKSDLSQIVLLYFKHGLESVSIYPNPATQTLNVQYISSTEAQLRIMDISGKVLYSQNLEQGNNTSSISIAHFAAGTYMLQLISENGMNKSIRFVKL